MSRYEDDESKGKNVCVCVCVCVLWPMKPIDGLMRSGTMTECLRKKARECVLIVCARVDDCYTCDSAELYP